MISGNVEGILKELGGRAQLVAAAKTRTAAEITQALEAGVAIIGQNYVSEAKKVYPGVGIKARWHFIGRASQEKHSLLRKNALELFDMIETVDSFDLARDISEKCRQYSKVMPILLEINSGNEPQKAGVSPEQAEAVAEKISALKNVRLEGVMTMRPRFGEPEASRPYYIRTRGIFERLKSASLPGTEIKYLSMGMSNSWRIALEEGANLVRLGAAVFGANPACGLNK